LFSSSGFAFDLSWKPYVTKAVSIDNNLFLCNRMQNAPLVKSTFNSALTT